MNFSKRETCPFSGLTQIQRRRSWAMAKGKDITVILECTRSVRIKMNKKMQGHTTPSQLDLKKHCPDRNNHTIQDRLKFNVDGSDRRKENQG